MHEASSRAVSTTDSFRWTWDSLSFNLCPYNSCRNVCLSVSGASSISCMSTYHALQLCKRFVYTWFHIAQAQLYISLSPGFDCIQTDLWDREKGSWMPALWGVSLPLFPTTKMQYVLLQLTSISRQSPFFLVEVLKRIVHLSKGICHSHLSRQFSCICSVLTLASKLIWAVAYSNLSHPSVFCCSCHCPNWLKILSSSAMKYSSVKTLWFRTRLLFMSVQYIWAKTGGIEGKQPLAAILLLLW